MLTLPYMNQKGMVKIKCLYILGILAHREHSKKGVSCEIIGTGYTTLFNRQANMLRLFRSEVQQWRLKETCKLHF